MRPFLAALLFVPVLPGCVYHHDLRKEAAEKGRAAAAEEIASGHPVLYGGPSFGGGPSPDPQTGLPVIWSGDHAPNQYENDFNNAHNQYVKEHLRRVKPQDSQAPAR